MDSVVPGRLAILCVYAASGHNSDFRSFSHIKIIVYQIIYIPMGDAGGDEAVSPLAPDRI